MPEASRRSERLRGARPGGFHQGHTLLCRAGVGCGLHQPVLDESWVGLLFALRRSAFDCCTRQGSLPSDVVARICDEIRAELERKDLKTYVNSILTAHVVKRPPDHEAGLALLLRLKGTTQSNIFVYDSKLIHAAESEPDLVEDAVKYIIFLVDADKLFDTALGMYDFALVLMVAQHAQKVISMNL